MRRIVAAVVAVGALGGAVALGAGETRPVSELEYVVAQPGDSWWGIRRDLGLSCTHTELWAANGGGTLLAGQIVLVPPSCRVAPTTTTTTTVAPPTTVASTAPTLPPDIGEQFVETFDGGAGLDRLDVHVYHRDDDLYDGLIQSKGGTWPADHGDLPADGYECGGPTTSRTLSHSHNDSQAARRANAIYACRNHMMTSMGDVDSYSIVSFSPAVIFPEVTEIGWDVSLTDLGTRTWFKVGVISEAQYNSTYANWAGRPVPGFLFSDVGASDLPTSLAAPTHLLASWSGGASAGHPGKLKIGDTGSSVTANPSPADKATRWPGSLTDNGNGTITFTVAGQSFTAAGEFPECPCRVVWQHNAYTPRKSIEETGVTPIGFTLHWDNLTVR